MSLIYNRPTEKIKRQSLRRDMTWPERMLWSRLKGNQINNHKFRRQHSIGKYIVDFYCPELKTAIELDGYTHDLKDVEIYDKVRDGYLNSLGIKVIRISNKDVINNIKEVIEIIEILK